MSNESNTHISMQAAKAHYDAGGVLLDVREPDEWSNGHIRNACHVPRGQVCDCIEAKVPDKSEPVVIYCAAGARAHMAAQTMREMGYEDVMPMEGGYSDWEAAGHPVEK